MVTPCLTYFDTLRTLLGQYNMQLDIIQDSRAIEGSFWGDSEAGLVENRLIIRADTPVHSALHEACHYLCMDQQRRNGLHTDAGGDYDEENAVCYLQILLAEYLDNYSPDQMMKDMDHWGYTFRLGSARAWFEHDADDALNWLMIHGIVGTDRKPTWKFRD